jgi:uncharacterized membrane protein
VTVYYWLKTIHIVSSTVLFGTGLGTAFFKWMTDRSGNVQAIRIVAERVVLADWIFTTPAIVIQAITGVALARLAGFPLSSGWVSYAIGLYVLTGACWIPVVWLQIKMRDHARVAVSESRALPTVYWSYARIWFWLGVPAFAAVVVILGLMVWKPAG